VNQSAGQPPHPGRWRIVETDLWADDSLDLLGPAYFELGADNSGYLVVGALQADVDYRIGRRDGRPIVEFSWLGDDDGHPASGRGSAELDVDGGIRVKLFIHRGDETTMVGVPPGASPRAGVSTKKPARVAGRRRRP
jgi:hypothetical protein